MRTLENRDYQYKIMLNEKLQVADNGDLIRVYNEDPGYQVSN